MVAIPTVAIRELRLAYPLAQRSVFFLPNSWLFAAKRRESPGFARCGKNCKCSVICAERSNAERSEQQLFLVVFEPSTVKFARCEFIVQQFERIGQPA